MTVWQSILLIKIFDALQIELTDTGGIADADDAWPHETGMSVIFRFVWALKKKRKKPGQRC
jgi:hypothetical protein